MTHEQAWRAGHSMAQRAYGAWKQDKAPEHECVAAAAGAAMGTYWRGRTGTVQ